MERWRGPYRKAHSRAIWRIRGLINTAIFKKRLEEGKREKKTQDYCVKKLPLAVRGRGIRKRAVKGQ